MLGGDGDVVEVAEAAAVVGAGVMTGWAAEGVGRGIAVDERLSGARRRSWRRRVRPATCWQ